VYIKLNREACDTIRLLLYDLLKLLLVMCLHTSRKIYLTFCSRWYYDIWNFLWLIGRWCSYVALRILVVMGKKNMISLFYW